MQSRDKLCLMTVLLCSILPQISLAQGTVSDPTVCSTRNGVVPSLGSFYGVTACSDSNPPEDGNGKQQQNTQTGFNTGLEWECVEYVDRFYYLYYGIKIGGRDANQWWGNFQSDHSLTEYQNGETTTPPKIGDIIVSSYANGHVAIVRSVTGNSVCTAQQNWGNDPADVNGTADGQGKRCTALTQVGNTFYAAPLYNGTHYTVDGWLRRPCSTNISEVYAFQAHPEGTMVTADGSTVYLLYSDSSSGSLESVGISDSAAFRNPYN